MIDIKDKIAKAKSLFRRFTGHTPAKGDIGVLDFTGDPHEVVFLVGSVSGILYETIRDGKRESYIHEFGEGPKSGTRDKKRRPVLAISFDGKRTFILAGGYRFTDRGFVG